MLRDELIAALEALGVSADARELDALTLHAEMMLARNEVQNLTRITAERDVAFLHVADSVAALPFLLDAPEGAFADLGSGAGYPGIPLAVLSGRRVALVESRAKKAAFLEDVVHAIGLDAEIVARRAEELAADRRAAFTAVTARALAPLPSLVELAAPLLAPGGTLVALKGDPGDGELAAGDAAAEMVGLRRIKTDSSILPGTNVRRTIVTYERRGEAHVDLPRRPGMAQRRPLA